MKENVEPLVNDGFAGDAAKRCLIYIQTQAGKGKNVVGIYCGYAPMEVICAADIVPWEKENEGKRPPFVKGDSGGFYKAS